MGVIESTFDILYLLGVIVLSFIILRKGIIRKQKATIIFGIMGLLLGFGDAFHLVPRIMSYTVGEFETYKMALGIGKLITSVTMTVFYYLIYLYYVNITHKKNNAVNYTLIGLIILRFALLALPGNDWANNGNDLLYGVLRNLPFLIIGITIVYLFLTIGKEQQYRVFKLMGLWIIVSFVCYTIVVLGSGFIPALGAFMLPKTVAYFIVIYLGYKNIE